MNNEEIKETNEIIEQVEPITAPAPTVSSEKTVEKEVTPTVQTNEDGGKTESKDGLKAIFKEPKRLVLFFVSLISALALIIAGSVLLGLQNRDSDLVNKSSYSGSNSQSYPVITNQRTVIANSTYQYFKFEPNITGYYLIYAESTGDTVGELFDSSFKSIKKDDDSGTGNNFNMEVYLYRGSTYYIGIKCFTSIDIDATLYVQKR